MPRMTLRDWRHALNASPSYRISGSTLRCQVRLVISVLVIGLLLLLYVKIDDVSAPNTGLYNATYPLSVPITTRYGLEYPIGMVADLDKASKVDTYTWASYFRTGVLVWNADERSAVIRWTEGQGKMLKSAYGLGGRGMELSELIVFDGRLLTFDDRTGIVYEVRKGDVIPWVLLMDGDGHSNKGFKSEWATVKNGELIVGSMGKEWTSAKGDYVNHNPMWVKQISTNGEVKHIDWIRNYRKLRQSLQIDFPGYMIHESGVWSDIHKKWFFLPRRSSHSSYDEDADEHQGTNLLLVADEEFEEINVYYIGNVIPTRGYSSFKFIPSTNDMVIVALKSEEFKGKIATYITIFTIDGDILVPDIKISDKKFEGLEFI